jgi:hypothetical protein
MSNRHRIVSGSLLPLYRAVFLFTVTQNTDFLCNLNDFGRKNGVAPRKIRV